MEEASMTAEDALAALSFLSHGISSHGQQHGNILDVANYKDAAAGDKHDDIADQQSPIANHHCESRTLDDDKLHILIPGWVEDCDEEDDSIVSNDNHNDDPACMSWLESLSPDLSGLILTHLSVQDLSQVSYVSRSMHRSCRTKELWRSKFLARWNYEGSRSENWWKAYQVAYANPHDLWVTHWNCVVPDDGDSPGRCCIPKHLNELKHEQSSNCMHYCPSCRYSTRCEGLPSIVQQAMDKERHYCNNSNENDPVKDAETVAAAYALLMNDESESDLSTHAKAICASTQYSIAKWCRRVKHLPEPISKQSRVQRARQAFQAASTFHRTIRPSQYETDSLNILTDVLFFNVKGSHLSLDAESKLEMEHLRRDVCGHEHMGSPLGANTVSSLGPHLETSHHTWHIVRLTNPDYVRPISFRVFVQRPDCFTVYPSEGYLKPGQTCHLVLGVRLLGSLLSEAFEALNVQREEVDPFLADLYATEAHLPYAPFAIRYIFAPVTPCIPQSFTSRGGTRPAQSLARAALIQAATSKYKNVVDYLWENVATEASVRTFYLSAHVNANYRFEEFQRATMFPFDTKVRSFDDWGSKNSHSLDPLVFVAPNLFQKDPVMFNRLTNLNLEMELSDRGQAYRTEKRCRCCGSDWGARSEELGRAYMLQTLVCDLHERNKNLRMRNLVILIRLAYKIVHARGDATLTSMVLERANELLYSLHSLLIQKRATPLMSYAQRRRLLQLECIVDELCHIVQERMVKLDNTSTTPDDHAEQCADGILPESQATRNDLWRNVGVYRHTRCTDSVFGRAVDLQLPRVDLSFTPIMKDELDYLEGFSYLCHSPGLYCLGQQQDPNHEDPDIPLSDSSSRLYRACYHKKRARNTDIFMDTTTLAFASALSMVHDPRSLLVHGVYDHVPYPGTVSRRPTMPVDAFSRVSNTARDVNVLMDAASAIIKTWKRRRLEWRPQHDENTDSLRFDLSRPQLRCLQLNDMDIDGHELLHLHSAPVGCTMHHCSSLRNYLRNVPAPGLGKYSLSDITGDDDASSSAPVIIPSPLISHLHNTSLPENSSVTSTEDTAARRDGLDQPGEQEQAQRQVPPNANNHGGVNPFVGALGRGPRVVNMLWAMSAHLGWTVDESHGAVSIMVDRRILIASQWISNSLMAVPLLWTLLARYVQWITTRPIEYHLEGLPFELDSEMRYLNTRESGMAAVVVVLLWLFMGRYAERRIGRSFERSMMEHLSPHQGSRYGFLARMITRCCIWFERQWDKICPLFLQRRVFSPRWNRRSEKEVLNHIASWRSKDLREHRSNFNAEAGQGVLTFGASEEDGPPVELKEASSNRKLLAGLMVSLGSFLACSPHFFFNLLTIICCSIGLGMSMSLQSMEVGRGTSSPSTSARSVFKPFGLNTVVIAFFLVGQLVGSSGGVLFLAEFVVTSVSLVLGGAGTISASAVESWCCFFGLSSTAFWGYLFARVGLADGIRNKRRGASSIVLCGWLVVLSGLWIISLCLWNWDTPPALMILRNSLSKDRRTNRKYVAQHLQ